MEISKTFGFQKRWGAVDTITEPLCALVCFSPSPLPFRKLWRTTKISLLLNGCWAGSSFFLNLSCSGPKYYFAMKPRSFTCLCCSRYHSLPESLTICLCFPHDFISAGSQAVFHLSLKMSYLDLQSLWFASSNRSPNRKIWMTSWELGTLGCNRAAGIYHTVSNAIFHLALVFCEATFS